MEKHIDVRMDFLLEFGIGMRVWRYTADFVEMELRAVSRVAVVGTGVILQLVKHKMLDMIVVVCYCKQAEEFDVALVDRDK